MDTEQTIAEIERLERIFAEPDNRRLSASDLAAANRRHDEMLAHSPWFRLWQRYGVCCQPEPPVLRLGDMESENPASIRTFSMQVASPHPVFAGSNLYPPDHPRPPISLLAVQRLAGALVKPF